jgi:hypothetical protein
LDIPSGPAKCGVRGLRSSHPTRWCCDASPSLVPEMD